MGVRYKHAYERANDGEKTCSYVYNVNECALERKSHIRLAFFYNCLDFLLVFSPVLLVEFGCYAVGGAVRVGLVQ